MNGTIKKIMSEKRFGFIRGTGEREFFFHADDFNGHWDDLDKDFRKQEIHVEFKETYSEKGPRATNVRRLDWPNQAA